MIKLEGTLVVKTRNGKNGPFFVGDLTTTVGGFKVKSKLLEQFAEGTYQGIFVISKIFQQIYSTGSSMIAEMRAELETIELRAEPEIGRVNVVVPIERDPLEEQQPTPQSAPSLPDQPLPAPVADDDDQTLFGREVFEQFCIGQTVKLDPSVDRALLRQQARRLKETGYQFDPKAQVWNKAK
jgi:Protein of unknown function (DUF3275)